MIGEMIRAVFCWFVERRISKAAITEYLPILLIDVYLEGGNDGASQAEQTEKT